MSTSARRSNGRCGARITTHPELLEALELSGAGTRDLGITVERRIALDRKGRVIADKPSRQILTSWDRLQRLLRIRCRRRTITWAGRSSAPSRTEAEVVAHFSGGRRERADLLIGADGIRSGVRAEVAPQVQPIYAATTSGAARRTRPTSRRKRARASFLTSCSICPSASRSSVIRSPDSTTTCGRDIAATISSGTGSPTPRPCARCASTRMDISTRLRFRRR